MLLSETKCRNAKPRAKPYKLADGNGLYLEVLPNGGRYWRQKYRFLGKEKRLAHGVYPTITLAEARQMALEARKRLTEGHDPAIVKQQRKLDSQIRQENNFEAVAREWHEKNKIRWKNGHAERIMRFLELDVFPELGRLPVTSINSRQLLNIISKIEKRGAVDVAHRTLQYCRRVFTYAITTGRTENNPAIGLNEALQPVKHGHYAAIKPDEIPDFLRMLEKNDARLYRQTRIAVKLLMLTFVRTGELIMATWDEFDFATKQWIIPGSRMKMKTDHIVPLADQAIALLRELQDTSVQSPWVLPSIVRPMKHISNNTILKALERLGYKGRMTGHGFRALGMTAIKEKLGYRHEIVDRQLAHARRNKVDAAYDRAEFLPERTEMMQKWADYLDQQLTSNIVLWKQVEGCHDKDQKKCRV